MSGGCTGHSILRPLEARDVPALQRFLAGRDRERAATCLPALAAGDAFARVVAPAPAQQAAGFVIVHLRLRADQGWEPGGGTERFQGDGHAYLENLEVAPDLRGRGLGSALLDAAEAESRERGVHSLWLHVREGNAAARRLYERRGYRPVERVAPAWALGTMWVYRLRLRRVG